MYSDAKRRELEYKGRPSIGDNLAQRSLADLVPKIPFSLS